MGYANDKGAEGEREFASYLNETFSPFGFAFVRIGGTEKSKKLLHGDVVLDPRTDKKELCTLRDYFLEAKKRKSLDLFKLLGETEEKADKLGRRGVIMYAVRQGRGSKRDGTIIAMTKKSFKMIMQELQGYKQEYG